MLPPLQKICLFWAKLQAHFKTISKQTLVRGYFQTLPSMCIYICVCVYIYTHIYIMYICILYVCVYIHIYIIYIYIISMFTDAIYTYMVKCWCRRAFGALDGLPEGRLHLLHRWCPWPRMSLPVVSLQTEKSNNNIYIYIIHNICIYI
jgi:hypothetical protein